MIQTPTPVSSNSHLIHRKKPAPPSLKANPKHRTLKRALSTEDIKGGSKTSTTGKRHRKQVIDPNFLYSKESRFVLTEADYIEDYRKSTLQDSEEDSYSSTSDENDDEKTG